MNTPFSRPMSLRGLVAAAAAGLAALSVSSPATASGASAGLKAIGAAPAGVQLSATARHVIARDLPKAGTTGHARALPNLRPSRGATSTASSSASTATATAPKAVATGTSGFVGDSYTQQTTTYPGPGNNPATSDQVAVPPDNGTASNGQYVVEFLNSSGWVYLRNNGAAGAITSFDLNSLFIAPSDQSSYFFSDPRVVWDPAAGRWWASGLAFTTALASKEYIAVSDNWDATGGWTVNTIWSSATVLGDQPRLGVTSDKVVDFWDDYLASNSTFTNEDGMSITKAALEAGTTLNGTNSHEFTNAGWFAVVPAWYSTTGDTWAMWNDTDNNLTEPAFAADGKEHVVHITGTASSPTFAETSYSPHAGSTGGGTGMQAPQQGPVAGTSGGPPINTDDDRTTVTAFDGTNLVSSTNTTCNVGTSTGLICVRIFRATIASGTPSYVGDANIGAAGKDVYYGAPALDGSGNLSVGFTESDASTMWPSSAISGAAAGTPLLFSTPTVTHAGQAMYNEPIFAGQDCVSGSPPGGTFGCRWGDYSGAQPDTCDASFVWTSTEFSDSNTTSGANWSTWISPETFSGAHVPANCANAPVVTQVVPGCGTSGTSVTINGTGFVTGSVVYFGNTLASSSIVSPTQMTATAPAPASTPSTVDISVVNANGDSALSAADQYSYVSNSGTKTAPVVTSVAPDTNPADGTTSGPVTVTGNYFQYPLTVHFGTVGDQVVGAAGPTATCTSVTVNAPTTSTPQAVVVTVSSANGTTSSNSTNNFWYIDGGYTLNAFGATYPFGHVQPPPARTDNPSWNFKIGREMILRQDHGSGYILDGYGGIHPFGGAPVVTGYPYFPNFDIARDIALDPCDPTQTSGYVLDGWGGVHPFGGAPVATGYPYWPGWDIARKIVMNSCGHGGYVLDGYGGMHPFNGAPDATGYPYFPGLDIARGIVLTGDSMGYILDGYGGVHPFGGQATATGYPYWPGWDIARGIADVPGLGLYVLDGYGGIHPINGSPAVNPGSYSSGHDIFRDID